MTIVKICGMTEPARIEQACAAGADYVGFVFFPPSRRHVTPEQAATLAEHVSDHVETVGLFVDPDDRIIETTLMSIPLDVIQLHGDETPERVAEIGLRFGVRTMKAVRLAVAQDLAPLPAFADAADMILFDAKPVLGAVLPGGNGLPFDWRLLADVKLDRPWLLAGGLTTDNLLTALGATGAPGVDVSSGVEVRPGVKEPIKLATFIAAAKNFRKGEG